MNPRAGLFLLAVVPASLWASVADFTPAKPVIPSRVFNLRDFGAPPTGNAASTGVFRAALAAVEKAGGGTLVIPAGDYFLGPIDLCSNLDFHLEAGAHLRFSQNAAEYRIPTAAKYRPMIWAQNRHDVVVSGSGTLDGQGQPWWLAARRAYDELRAGRPPGEGIVRPRLLTMDHCERVRLEGVTLLDSPQIQFLASHCDDIEVVKVVAIAPPRSPNTGAVGTSGSSRIVITGCRFDVGDDCIAINGGSSDPAEDIRVTDCTFLHGHGCSIGSDTRGGVRNMLVSHCDFQGTEIGIRLKSGRGRGGLVENLTYSDLTMENVGHAIQLSSYYPESTWPKPGSHDQAQPLTERTPQWRGLTIRRLTATGGTKDAGRIIGLPESPATDLTLEDVRIDAPIGLRIGCAKNVTLRNVQVTAGSGAPFIVEDTVEGLPRAGDRPDGVTESQVMIPMRDGVRLSAYLYFPKGAGPWPVLYQQLYLTTQSTGFRRQALMFAAAGYVVAQENFRGTQLSEGAFSGYRALGWGEHQDGYDTVEWLARQVWSDGKVGTFGPSQAGFAQNFLAVAEPPHLICQYIVDGGLSLFSASQRLGGITRPLRFAETMLPAARHPDEARRFLQTQFEHPDYDDYWRGEDCSLHLAAMNVPAVEVASWYDFMSPGGIQTFIGRQHSGGPGAQGRQKLVIGPWIHGGNDKMATKVGDLTYPANSHYDLDADMIRWFDHFLKGRPNGAERAPAVRYYVMGASGEAGAPGNFWRETDDWPVAARDQSYFLRERDSLSLQGPEPQEGSTEFLSDPLHPAPMPGRFYPAAKDDRRFERDPNVRTFTSEALADPVEWTGRVRAELYVSSSARDTDFIARVCDVYPDGRSIMLIDSIRRARYRDGFEHSELLVPGRIYRIAFDVGWISQIFNRGHRIRVDLSGTAADFYEPSPNTGQPFSVEAPSQTMVAHDTLYHSRRYASRLIAPLACP